MNLVIAQRARIGAFTFAEVLVATAIGGLLFLSLYAGITYGFSELKNARLRLRASQILLDKLEVVRLYNWDQVNSNGFIPSKFMEYDRPAAVVAGTNVPAGGLAFHGTMALGPATSPAAYSNSLRRAVVTVRWTNGSAAASASMETLVSQHGVQNYIY